MASINDQRWQPLPLRFIAGTDLVDPGLYYRIGASTEQEGRLVKIDNLTDVNVFMSLNGVWPFTVIPANANFVLDITTNEANGSGLFVDAGTQFWVAADTTPTTGYIYVSVLSSTSG